MIEEMQEVEKFKFLRKCSSLKGKLSPISYHKQKADLLAHLTDMFTPN